MITCNATILINPEDNFIKIVLLEEDFAEMFKEGEYVVDGHEKVVDMLNQNIQFVSYNEIE